MPGSTPCVAVDLLPGRLAAAERLGAVTFDASTLDKEQVVAGVREATQGGPTFGVETTAVPEVVRQAVDVLGPTGKLVVLGLSMATPEFSVDAVDLLQNGKTIRGSIEGDSDPQVMIPQLIAANSSGAFDVDGLMQTLCLRGHQPSRRGSGSPVWS